MTILLIVIGSVMTLYGLILSAFSNLNLGVILVLLIGVLFLGWGIFYKKIKSMLNVSVFKGINIALCVIICLESVFMLSIGIYGHSDNVTYDENAVIVLGAGIHGDRVSLPLKYRLDKAVEYHKKNPGAVIVVTGGKGMQETVTEAYAMEKYLAANGVEPGRIIKEEKATSTNENMRLSKKILDSYFKKDYKTAVITNDFHIYRAVNIARLEGIGNVTHIHAGLSWYNIIPCYLRESLAVLKMWVFG